MRSGDRAATGAALRGCTEDAAKRALGATTYAPTACRQQSTERIEESMGTVWGSFAESVGVRD